jgi:hypothetical protein
MADAQPGMHKCIADVVYAYNLRDAMSHKSHRRLPLVNEQYGMLSDKFSSLFTSCFRSWERWWCKVSQLLYPGSSALRIRAWANESRFLTSSGEGAELSPRFLRSYERTSWQIPSEWNQQMRRIPVLLVLRLYMFRAVSLPIIRSS